jgi:hypothetical protein
MGSVEAPVFGTGRLEESGDVVPGGCAFDLLHDGA